MLLDAVADEEGVESKIMVLDTRTQEERTQQKVMLFEPVTSSPLESIQVQSSQATSQVFMFYMYHTYFMLF